MPFQELEEYILVITRIQVHEVVQRALAHDTQARHRTGNALLGASPDTWTFCRLGTMGRARVGPWHGATASLLGYDRLCQAMSDQSLSHSRQSLSHSREKRSNSATGTALSWIVESGRAKQGFASVMGNGFPGLPVS